MAQSLLLTGASSGIGAACASHLADRNLQVFGTSRRPPAGAAADTRIHWIPMDVCDAASVEAGVAEVIAEAGKLDALVCNAGFGIFGSVEEVSLELAQQQFDTNFFGVLRTLRSVIPHMRRAQQGRIVVIGSLAGRAPIPFQSHYSASKAAVDNLTLALRSELRPFGVHVSLLEPGDIATPFNDAMRWEEGADSHYGDQIRNCEAAIREALPKAPGPEVVARCLYKILTARKPRVRYTVGPASWLVPLGRRIFPDRLTLRLIRDTYRL